MWRSGKDQKLHPDDPQELQEVFQLCLDIVEGGKEQLPARLLNRLEGDGEELEEAAQEELTQMTTAGFVKLSRRNPRREWQQTTQVSLPTQLYFLSCTRRTAGKWRRLHEKLAGLW